MIEHVNHAAHKGIMLKKSTFSTTQCTSYVTRKPMWHNLLADGLGNIVLLCFKQNNT